MIILLLIIQFSLLFDLHHLEYKMAIEVPAFMKIFLRIRPLAFINLALGFVSFVFQVRLVNDYFQKNILLTNFVARFHCQPNMDFHETRPEFGAESSSSLLAFSPCMPFQIVGLKRKTFKFKNKFRSNDTVDCLFTVSHQLLWV